MVGIRKEGMVPWWLWLSLGMLGGVQTRVFGTPVGVGSSLHRAVSAQHVSGTWSGCSAKGRGAVVICRTLTRGGKLRCRMLCWATLTHSHELHCVPLHGQARSSHGGSTSDVLV